MQAVSEKGAQVIVDIVSAMVLVQANHPDQVELMTRIKGPFPEEDSLSFTFRTPSGKGASYVKRHFRRVKVEVVNTTRPQ